MLEGTVPSGPTTIPEISAQAQMDTLAKEASEPHAAYYQRAVNTLPRTHSRDRLRTTESIMFVLTGLEEFTLGCVVNAFVRGLYDPYLRRKVMNYGGASCGSLWLSYDIVLQTQKAIQEKKLLEEQLAERKKVVPPCASTLQIEVPALRFPI